VAGAGGRCRLARGQGDLRRVVPIRSTDEPSAALVTPQAGAHTKKCDLAIEGMASFSICSRFPQISIPASRVLPVRLPPGRAKLVTSPAFSGSSMNATTGIVLVAAMKAITTGLVPVTINSLRRR